MMPGVLLLLDKLGKELLLYQKRGRYQNLIGFPREVEVVAAGGRRDERFAAGARLERWLLWTLFPLQKG
jgi:hypothetical protein